MFEPSADARIMAKTLRDIYLSLINEGFTEAQAFKMVDTIIWSGNIGNSLGGS